MSTHPVDAFAYDHIHANVHVCVEGGAQTFRAFFLGKLVLWNVEVMAYGIHTDVGILMTGSKSRSRPMSMLMSVSRANTRS